MPYGSNHNPLLWMVARIVWYKIVHVDDFILSLLRLYLFLFRTFIYGFRYLFIGLAGKVADMSATCRPDSQKSALLADSAKSCRHKFVPDTFFCVGVCRLSPNFL